MRRIALATVVALLPVASTLAGGTSERRGEPTRVIQGTRHTATMVATPNLAEDAARQRRLGRNPETEAEGRLLPGVEEPGESVEEPQPLPVMPLPSWVRPLGHAIPGALFAVEPPSTLSPPLLNLGFQALPDNNSAIPPDTHGAVGPSHVMTALNTQVRVQNRSGGSLLTKPLNAPGITPGSGFWYPVNKLPDSTPEDKNAFDPRVIYDPLPSGGRFVTAACDDAGMNSSALMIAASQTGDPTAGWYMARIPIGGTVWADYPTLGFNKNWIVLQANMFRISDNGFQESRVYVINRASLYAGTLSYTLFTLPGATYGGTQVPAVEYDSTVDDLYLLEEWNPGLGALHMYRVTLPVAAPVLQELGYPIGATWATSVGAADFAPQLQGPTGCEYCFPGPCPARKIQVNDSRLQSVVYRNGKLWTTHTVFLPTAAPTRVSVQWWQIDTASTVLQQGRVDDGTGVRSFAFPSLAVNKNDDVLLGYSRFQGTEYAGASYSFRTSIDPLSTMQSEARLKDGVSCYYKDFSYGRNRWGDYSATVVDPADDKTLWTIQEYADTSAGAAQYDDRWATWWGYLDPTPTVSINDVSVSEGNSGTTTLNFTVSLSFATSATVTVPWSTANGTATVADGDYVQVTGGSVTFNPGATSQTLQVTVNGDTRWEPDETLLVNLGTPTNATNADNQGQGTILNDDGIPQISIDDVTQAEGNGGSGATPFLFTVSLSNPSSVTVGVTAGTTNGTAIAGVLGTGDFIGATSSVTFAPGVVSQSFTVQVHGDTIVEPDELFYLDLTSPTNATILKSRGVGTILDDDATNPGVEDLTIVSDGTIAAGGHNHLQWVNPNSAAPSGIQIKWNSSAGACASPDPANPTVASMGTMNPPYGGAALPQAFDHTSLALDTNYCYTVWVQYGAGWSLPGATATARPFDAAGRIKWKYFTGTAAMAPPTVGIDGILAPGNDRLVHGMVRGASGGPWPPGPPAYVPPNLGSPAQARSPIVPMGGGSWGFFTTQDGRVFAVDARTGAVQWSTSIGTQGQAAPAGIFTAFGGAWDYILVGTRESDNNRFYALDPTNGNILDYFPKAADGFSGLGAVNGMAAVDYAAGLVYFATMGGSATDSLWCLKLGGAADPLSYQWSAPRGTIGDVAGSPVLRNGRVYVGNTTGTLWSVKADDGTNRYSYSVGEAIKDFPFPDRGSNALYFATTTQVFGVLDTGTGFSQKWPPITGLTSPSPVLFWAGGAHLYVGIQAYTGQPQPGAWILDIDPATGAFTPIQLESGTAIAVGAPSLDIGVTPNLLHAGSVAGVVYAVSVP
jgi:outer membrane protein assembly factor BamB